MTKDKKHKSKKSVLEILKVISIRLAIAFILLLLMSPKLIPINPLAAIKSHLNLDAENLTLIALLLAIIAIVQSTIKHSKPD